MTIVTIDLRTEAAADAERLTAARALTRQGDDEVLARLEGDGPWIIGARPRALRQTVGTCALMIWRVACEDASGRIVESHVVATSVQLSGTRARWRRRSQVDAFVRAVDHEAVAVIERSSEEWRIAVERTARRFTSTRAARERAIARAAHTDSRSCQPGLFDRRATRTSQARAASTAEADRAIADRLSAIERTATATPQPPQLLLVVVP